MRKLFTLIIAIIATAPTYADNITDGLSISGDHIYSYTPVVQTLCLVLASIIGVVGAFSVYTSYINNHPNMSKKVLTWGGSCLTMLCMTLALPTFFEYQESGLGGSGSTSGGGTGDGTFAGGDSYGRLDPTIPDLSDSRWVIDDRCRPIIIDGRPPLPNRPILIGGL